MLARTASGGRGPGISTAQHDDTKHVELSRIGGFECSNVLTDSPKGHCKACPLGKCATAIASTIANQPSDTKAVADKKDGN